LIRALIDTAALRHNLGTIRAYAPRAKVMAVVKANAYGHGLVATALALADADAFAVARLEEGIALRGAGVRAPVVLLEGVFSADQLAEASQHGFELVVHDPQQLRLLENYRGTRRFVVWIKVDTGMNRLGFRPEALAAALGRLRVLTVPALELRVMTHLARADERDQPMTDRPAATRHQHREFRGDFGMAARAWGVGAARARPLWRFAVPGRNRAVTRPPARHDARNHGAHRARGEAG
jgi:alanine racemase